eukprot:365455-Chlamydomonas_euryale.AAC.9
MQQPARPLPATATLQSSRVLAQPKFRVATTRGPARPSSRPFQLVKPETPRVSSQGVSPTTATALVVRECAPATAMTAGEVVAAHHPSDSADVWQVQRYEHEQHAEHVKDMCADVCKLMMMATTSGCQACPVHGLRAMAGHGTPQQALVQLASPLESVLEDGRPYTPPHHWLYWPRWPVMPTKQP